MGAPNSETRPPFSLERGCSTHGFRNHCVVPFDWQRSFGKTKRIFIGHFACHAKSTFQVSTLNPCKNCKFHVQKCFLVGFILHESCRSSCSSARVFVVDAKRIGTNSFVFWLHRFICERSFQLQNIKFEEDFAELFFELLCVFQTISHPDNQII